MLPEQHQRILGYFIEEAKDHLNTLEQGLLNLQNTIDDTEMVNEVFRAAHSVKGGASMLGIDSIAKTAHRLEDYFKELKEHPIRVDQKLETLFLRVFDTLQSLLDQLQGPFGLTEDVAEGIMSGADTVFEELKQHLDTLLNSPRPATAPKPKAAEKELLVAAFTNDVMEMLRQMLQLFKPPSWPDSRSQLEGCCDRLGQLGEQFNLPTWTNLMSTASGAISNPENTAQMLAPIIIKEIKGAQELVLSGRAEEICASEQLQALQPVIAFSEEPEAESYDMEEFLSFDGEPEIPLVGEPIEDSFDFSNEITENNTQFDASVPEFWQTDRETVQPIAFSPSEDGMADSKFAFPSGPEVGAAELNTLADLFETDIELDAEWQDEETLHEAAIEPSADFANELNLDTDSEFADLFEDISSQPSQQAGFDEFDDALGLFDDAYPDEDNSPQLNQNQDATASPLAIENLEADSGEFGSLFDDVSQPPAQAIEQVEDEDFNLFDETIFVENNNIEQEEQLGDEEFGNLFEDESQPPVQAIEQVEDDDFSLFDETIFVENNNIEQEEQLGDEEFGNLFEDVSQPPVQAIEQVEDDDFSLFDETIFVENNSLDLQEEPLENIEAQDGFTGLFEDESSQTTQRQTEVENDDLSLFDRMFSEEDNSLELEADNLADTSAIDRQTTSPKNPDDLSQLFAGLDEDDLNWEELPADSEIDYQAEAFPQEISDELTTESDSNWAEDWAGVAVSDEEISVEENVAEIEDFSLDAESFGMSEIAPENSEQGTDLWGNDASEMLDFDETNADWSGETSTEAIADEIDDFDTSSWFGESPAGEISSPDTTEPPTAEETDLFGFNDFDRDRQDVDLAVSEQRSAAIEQEQPQAVVSKETYIQPTEESFDSFFSLQDETQAEFWGEESSELMLEPEGGGIEDMFSTSQDIFANSTSQDLWSSPTDGSFDLFGSSESAVSTELWPAADLSTEFDLDGTGTPELDGGGFQNDLTVEELDSNSSSDWDLGIEETSAPEAIATSPETENWDEATDNLIDDIFGTEQTTAEYPEEDFSANLETAEELPDFSFNAQENTEENWLSDESAENEDWFDAGVDNTQATVADNLSDFDAQLGDDSDFGELLSFGDPETENTQLDLAGDEDAFSPHNTAADNWLETSESDGLEWLEESAPDTTETAIGLGENAEETEDFGLDFASLDESAASDSQTLDDNAWLDLENMVSSGPATSPVAAIDGNGKNDGGKSAGDSILDDFGELEALLGESPAPSAAIPAQSLTNGSNDGDGLDFGELEALLGSEVPAAPTSAAKPAAAAAPKATASNNGLDEFDELEKMIAESELQGGNSGGSKSARVSQATQIKRPQKVWEQTMKVPVKHMDNLSNLVGELVVNRNTLEQDQERLRQCLHNLLNQVQQLSDVGGRMQDLYERSLLEASLLASRRSYRSGGLDGSGSHHTGVDYDPLEMDRFTGFHTLSQEMIELIVRVRESTSDIEFVTDETEQVCRQFRQVSTQLQEGLTRARMVPFGEIERVFPLMRYVRDKAAEFGKQAEIKIEGRETLIDKLILEHFSDPLKHLVNNALAHGIEMPDVRQRAGKPPVGRIVIRAFHQGNQTVISFSDDGAGIDVERVRMKAIQKKLITPAEAKTMSRHDIYQVIYHPGFSTKDEADSTAGRGVGMDVVLTSLSEIRGTITTDSTAGKGTTFTIRLPLTLSICKALCCLSDKARIAFPMDGVEDALDIEKERIQINAEGNPCIAWRDMVLPFRPLSELLTFNRHLGRGSVYGGTKEEDTISIVVLRSAGTFIALQVDQVLGEQEIVIKQLEGPIPKPLGVAGATVLGDGRIMPIGDVLELIDLSLGRIQSGGKIWERDASAAIAPEPPKTEPTVLIVDDSITVRELLSMTFNKAGYRVEQARDGQEAWDKLKSGLPCEIVFCDIEMPRMDGLELLSRLQKDGDLNHLPVAMLTSRGADKHRQMAIQLGARGYFTKPYLEEALLDAASRMLKGEVLVTSASNA